LPTRKAGEAAERARKKERALAHKASTATPSLAKDGKGGGRFASLEYPDGLVEPKARCCTADWN